ncbi:hypothetical protein JW752_04580 [Candidatus Peregrinibacteria bacterium]|nr:hypothetical protein [Candidatus Peregrinibacteria bacterium]
MKKLAFFFIILIGLVVIAGCNQTRKSVTRFSTDDEGKTVIEEVKEDEGPKTTITQLDNGEKTEPVPIEIPAQNDEEAVKFAVTSLSKSVLETDKGYHFIEGTTPATTEKIVVNGYTLNKYKPGSTKWSYIAAVALGTLKQGENNYTVRAFDAESNELGSETFSIMYSGIEAGKLVPTGNGLGFTLILTAMGVFGFYAVRRRFAD